MILTVSAALHKGRRENNEDVALYGEDFFIVADGMGGHASGEVAADIAVDTIEKIIEKSRHLDLKPGTVLRDAVRAANQAILKAAKASPEHLDMGTTVVALYVKDGIGAVAHAGDSRCYRLRDPPGLEQLTRDHAQKGSHILERALGTRHEVGDLFEAPVHVGDIYMLCSDGLIGLSFEKIESVLRSGGTAEDLVTATLELGDKQQDNMAVLVIRVLPSPGEGKAHDDA